MALVLTPNIDNPDGFYDALVQAHEGLNADESAAFNARLILILANQVGNEETLRAALKTAQGA
ncbi:DUF2783 domain-containing protein [Roseobacter sinensis]|uniref:DUF2783 domain-containing protein n=1 Tax=Roseobacter sinensis TaxID=2931391 RepID=A0ABT3BKG3_9RHOB|nr:DUF2783 domain-containing protein [Roseobacter sp. WL0113]MCV3273849.1 DUF2783 domain-containing protein [Roseobacter sp. WL0113]